MEFASILAVVFVCLCSSVRAGEESCVLVLEEPGVHVHTLISAGEIYTVDAVCAYFYCEPAALSTTGKPRMRRFSIGCKYDGRCLGKDETFYDENCYKKKCVLTDHDDGSVKAKIQFVSTYKKHCPAADGTCKPRGSKYFPCFLQNEYRSHCACVKSGKMSYLKDLLSFGAERIGTMDGNGRGEFCYFPFKFNGRVYEECIPNAIGSWCATTADFDRDGKFGLCIAPQSYRFTKDGYRCHFPFMYNDSLHHTCIKENRTRPWCGTKFEVQNKDDWDYCESV